MKTEQHKSNPSLESPKSTFVAGLFYTFVSLTVVAFLLHLFGLNWFSSKITLEEPPRIVQEIIKAALKAFELTFVYKILTKKKFALCILISVIQSIAVGFIPVGMFQSIADAVIMIALPLIFRKDRLWAFVDTLFLYAIMCIYGALTLLGKFGELESSQVYSFYKAILGMLDYKLFIVTIYLFIKYKGGFKLWKKMKRPLLG